MASTCVRGMFWELHDLVTCDEVFAQVRDEVVSLSWAGHQTWENNLFKHTKDLTGLLELFGFTLEGTMLVPMAPADDFFAHLMPALDAWTLPGSWVLHDHPLLPGFTTLEVRTNQLEHFELPAWNWVDEAATDNLPALVGACIARLTSPGCASDNISVDELLTLAAALPGASRA